MGDKNGFFGHNWGIWLAVTVGVILHVLKPPHPAMKNMPKKELWRNRAFATVAGYAIGVWFYAPVVEWRGLGESWEVPVALFLSTIGGSAARIVIEFDYAKLMEIFKVVRGSSSYYDSGPSNYNDGQPTPPDLEKLDDAGNDVESDRR